MKVLFTYMLPILFVGCVSLKNLNPKFERVGDTLPIRVNSSGIFCSVGLAGREYNFLLDTGATSSFIEDERIVKEKSPYAKRTYSSFGSKFNSEAYVLPSVNALFRSNDYTYYFDTKPSECKGFDYHGIVGSDFLNFDALKVVELNFSNNHIKVFSSQNDISFEGFTRVESKFFQTGYHVQIALGVNGAKEFFHFDTGNVTQYGILVIDKNSKIKLSNKFTLRKGQRANQTTVDYAVFKETVTIGNDSLSHVLSVRPEHFNGKYNNVGLSFIRNFDWILDYKNQNVYYRPRKVHQNRLALLSRANINKENELFISLINQEDESEHPLGATIKSVNDTQVTQENICEMRQILNTTNWNNLKLDLEKK